MGWGNAECGCVRLLSVMTTGLCALSASVNLDRSVARQHDSAKQAGGDRNVATLH